MKLRRLSGWALIAMTVAGPMAGCSGGAPGSGDGNDGGSGSVTNMVDAQPGDGGSGPELDGADNTMPGTGSSSDAGPAVADASAAGDGSPSKGADAGASGPGGDAAGTADGPNSGVDSGASGEAAWLVPMNAARTAVGETALTWNPIAAQVALDYAMMCNYQHNANRNSYYVALSGTGDLGENIAAGAPTQTIANAVASWVGEEANYDHATNTCAAGDECGHYTQIVWSTTTSVGCAKVSCTTNSPFGTFGGGRWDFSVCDYSPPGNFVGMSPY